MNELHGLGEHGLRGLLPDGIFWELHWKIVGVWIFEHGLLISGVVVDWFCVPSAHYGALRLRQLVVHGSNKINYSLFIINRIL
jgi:hypothetical protein